VSHAMLRGLYAITPLRMSPGLELAGAVEAALRGGATLVQYRDKSSNGDKREREARTLLQMCRSFGARLIINDDLALADLIGADGVHLGRDDADLSEARRLLGTKAIIGASCYSDFECARAARDSGADYVAFGSFYPSGTKPDAVRASPELISHAKLELRIPVAAIGGITVDNAAPLVAAGADLLAVVQGLFGQDDIEACARQFSVLFRSRAAANDAAAQT